MVAALVALLVGTVIGDDDHFPFGPFRMYSTTNKLDGLVRAAHVEGTTEHGEIVELEWNDLGLRRAEVEGQIDRFQADPELLSSLAVAYSNHVEDAPRLVEIRLMQRLTKLRDGRPTTSSDIELARWVSP